MHSPQLSLHAAVLVAAVTLVLFPCPHQVRALAYSCQHDHVIAEFKATWVSTTQSYDSSSTHFKRQSANTTTDDGYRPIRIRADYSNIDIDTDLEGYISKVLMPAALKWISSALAVVPVQGNLTLQRQCIRFYTSPFRCIEYAPPTCGSLATIPSAHFDAGVPNADFIVYVTNQPSVGEEIANGGTCQFDQNGRPVAGGVNFSPQNFGKAQSGTEDFRYQVNAVVHELFHALGFSSSLFGQWRNSQGEPYDSVTQTFNERNRTITKLVTPAALKKAREFFGCPNLNGVELEDQGGQGTAGSHWEKRILNQDFMTGVGVYGDYAAKSAVTLAAMEDSGWYRANYSAAETLYWGAGAGCEFTTEACLSLPGPTTPFSSYFCTDTSRLSCTPGRLARGNCNLATYTQDLPSAYQYFSDPTRGGALQLMDFCPYYQPFLVQGTNRTSLCTEPLNQPPVNYWGESYGPGSRCFESTITDSSFNSYLVNGGSTCHNFRCRSGTLQVSIKGAWVSCPTAGGSISVSGFRGAFTCPPANEMCPPPAAASPSTSPAPSA